MTTKLEGPLRREIEIAGTAYTLTITPDRMTLVVKGKRKGYELEWSALVSGEAALATALNASLMVPRTDSPAAKSAGHAPTKGKR